jgi:hypothetical protein
MEQIRKFLRDKGFALALLACLVAAAAAGVWAVRTVRDELDKNLSGLKTPDSTSTAPGIDEGLSTTTPQEDETMADRTRRKQCKQCAQGGLLGIAECIFGLLCAAGWLWLGARTIRAARCILACQQFGSACFHAADLWQGAQWIQRR